MSARRGIRSDRDRGVPSRTGHAKARRGIRSDRELGVPTSRTVRARTLEVAPEGYRHAHDYEPTPFGVLEDMMCGLDLDPAEHTFVDLGCGKGRVLLLASAWSFAKIIGVELAPALHEVAAANVRAFDAPWQLCDRIEVVLEDAATFKPPSGPLVVYLFNPFEAPVLESVLANLGRSFEESPRPIHLLYYMPEHEAVMGRAPWLARRWSEPNWSIYSAREV